MQHLHMALTLQERCLRGLNRVMFGLAPLRRDREQAVELNNYKSSLNNYRKHELQLLSLVSNCSKSPNSLGLWERL
jgi:hypothetical protein